MAKRGNNARWIWVAGRLGAVDAYVRLRRRFALRGNPVGACLRVAALGQYALWVNGRYVGSGPAPASADAPQADEYAATDLPLRRGWNVVAVLAHAAGLGLARAPRAEGGLWLRLQITYKNGSQVVVGTDRRWRAAEAEDFSRRAPRISWAAEFLEVRDTRREPAGWTDPAFDDRRWRRADVFVPRAAGGATVGKPRDRATPRPAETPVLPVRVQSVGRVRARPGSTAVPFDLNLLGPAPAEFYAATFVYSAGRRRARLLLDCDEGAAVYVNNRLAVRQRYDEAFVHWLAEAEHDNYPGTGMRRGQGRRAEPVEVDLEPGWNSLGVVLYASEWAWGFALALEDARTGRPMKVEFSPDRRRRDRSHWHILSEELCPCSRNGLPETPAPNGGTFPDPAYALVWEKESPGRSSARGAAALLARPKGKQPLVLKDSSYVRYDFAALLVGWVEVEVEGQAGAILDLAWAEHLAGRLDPVPGGMRHVDRLILRGGRQEVRLANRRALRYLELVCRSGDPSTPSGSPRARSRGDRPIKVHALRVHASSALPKEPAILRTKDRALEAVWRLCRRTVRACVQHTLEGAPGREAEQSVASAYLVGQVERIALGRTEREEAALRAFAADQDERGFFRALVPAGTRHVVPDWNLLWVVWLADYVAWTGDRALAEALLPAAERCLEWTAGFLGPSGLLENPKGRPAWWLLLDLEPMDKRGEVTAWQALYVRALSSAAEVAAWLGRTETAQHLRAEADAVAQRARERLWDARRGRFADARLFDRLSASAGAAANYYALWGGLASPRQAERILAGLWDRQRETADWGPYENPYAKFFALQALLAQGQVDRALAMVRTYWGAMAQARLATVPEVFRAGEGATTSAAALAGKPPVPPGASGETFGPHGAHLPPVFCHGWGAYVEALLARWVLGVHPAEPGFRVATLAPMPGNLEDVSGGLWTPKGRVEVTVRRSGGRRQVTVELPGDMVYRTDLRHLGPRDEVRVTGGVR